MEIVLIDQVLHNLLDVISPATAGNEVADANIPEIKLVIGFQDRDRVETGIIHKPRHLEN